GSRISIETLDSSGISELGYLWEGSSSWIVSKASETNIGMTITIAAPTVSVNTTKKLYVYAIDNSTNKNASDKNKYYSFEITTGIVNDTTPPVITVTPSSGKVASGGSITVEATDVSGISALKYGWAGAASWSTVSGTKTVITAPTVTANTTKKLYVYALDNSANKNTTDQNKYYTFEITAGGSIDVPGEANFKDVSIEHWAYNEIMEMSKSGIINGYSDGTFKPEKAVTRAEFAKMMVLSLNLALNNPSNATFVDLGSSHWAYKFVEAAKSYLTGYKTTEGMKYKPDKNAMREDVTVALVRAKGYQNDSVNEAEIYKTFKDANKISPNLRKYVLIAKKRGLINGDPNGKFRPQDTLTRAEAAKLLWQIANQVGDKVIID
ncbi:MAG: S-layer homology domain-containing protein, partial [Ignavibacteriales bacterium]